MSPGVVYDASALVALLLDDGPDGQWAAAQARTTDLAAPSLVTFETANMIRRSELAGLVSPDQCAQAHADLLTLDIELWPYDLLAARAWDLRGNVPIYDGAYVALAELIESRLVTLDRRIGGAPGLRCDIVTP